MTFGRPGADVLHLDVEPSRRMCAATASAICALARRARDERRVHGVDGDEVAQQRDDTDP